MFTKTLFKNKLKGSGILVVILSSIAFSIYIVSSFSEQEHYSIILDKYEKNITSKYEENVEDINQYYDDIMTKMTIENNI